MIITVVRGQQENLDYSGFVARALCGAGLTQLFPGNLPARPHAGGGGGIEVMCDVANGPRIRAGFEAVGFQVITPVGPLGELPGPSDLTTLTVTPGQEGQPGREKDVNYAATAATGLCAAGITQAFASGDPYQGDPDAGSIRVTCNRADRQLVQSAFVFAGFQAN